MILSNMASCSFHNCASQNRIDNTLWGKTYKNGFFQFKVLLGVFLSACAWFLILVHQNVFTGIEFDLLVQIQHARTKQAKHGIWRWMAISNHPTFVFPESSRDQMLGFILPLMGETSKHIYCNVLAHIRHPSGKVMYDVYNEVLNRLFEKQQSS